MTEIIPSINVQTFAEVQERVKKVEPFVSWCHLDVTDGIFSQHKTWNNPADLSMLDTKLKAEVHLMMREPEKVIENWLKRPIARIIVHLEAVSDMDWIIKECREDGVEIGIAINPETAWEGLQPWLEKVDLVQTLAVKPGPSGQNIAENTFEKIANIHKFCPWCIIEADGGVNSKTAQRAKECGASVLVAGSYIFNASDIQKAIEDLKEL